MNADDARLRLEHARSRLQAIHEERVAQYHSTQSVDASPADEAQIAADAYERSNDMWLGQHLDGRLDELGNALRRVEDGTYGLCDTCGEPIHPERLAALPAARYCVAHQRETERRAAFG